MEINKNYVLLKYYNFKNIPEYHVYEDKADEVYKFKAISDKYTFNDVIDSHSMVFYRCIEAEDLEWLWSKLEFVLIKKNFLMSKIYYCKY